MLKNLKSQVLKQLSALRPKPSEKSSFPVAGLWEDEKAFLEAVRKVRDQGRFFETISPFPVHGMEEAMGLKRSWIPWVTFFGGLFGFSFAVWFTWWASAVSWPILVGGKPFWSLAAFIPVIFELTVLFAALSSLAALLYACSMPKRSGPVIDPDLTCHKFALLIDCNKNESVEELKNFIQGLNPLEIVET